MSTKTAFDEALFETWHIGMVHQYQKIVWQLRQERRRQKISQKKLAAMLDISQARISEMEQCKETGQSLLRVLMIAQVLGMTLELNFISKDNQTPIGS